MNSRFTAAWFCVLLLSFSTFGQDKPNSADQRPVLQQILTQTYQPSEVGKHLMGIGSETDIRRAGIIVVVQREGLYGSLNRNEIASSAIHDTDAVLFRGHKDYPIPVGERFYVSSVSVTTSAVTFGLLSTRPATTSQGAGRVWAAASFEFPETMLANADRDPVLRQIDRWFVPEGRNVQSVAPAAAASSPVTVAPAPAPEPPAASAVRLTPGMSRDEIVAALGKPQREVNFQGQTWLHYPVMVVLLKDGKLALVDQSGPSSASIAIFSDPDGAEIYLDGQLIGSTPSTMQILAGNHQLSLKVAGYQDWARDINVLAGSEIKFAPKLTKQ